MAPCQGTRRDASIPLMALRWPLSLVPALRRPPKHSRPCARLQECVVLRRHCYARVAVRGLVRARSTPCRKPLS